MWYAKNGDFDSVMFVEATPDSELVYKVQKVIKDLKLKIKVMERAGTTVRAAEYIFVPGTTNFGDLSCPLKNNQIIPFFPYE